MTRLMSFLCRGLQFTQIALSRSQKDKTEEMTVSFTESYKVTLKKYHSFLVKPIFTVSPLTLPSLISSRTSCPLVASSPSKFETSPLRRRKQLAMNACPYRKDFYAKLGSPIEKVDTQLEAWLGALQHIISIIQPMVEGH